MRPARPHEHAVQFAQRSLQMSEGYDRGRVFNLTLLAHSRAQAGNLDQACEIGQQAATAATGMRSDRVVKHLRDFRQALAPAEGSADVAALDVALAPLLSAA